MGFDLALLPMVDSEDFSHEILEVRNHELFGLIKELPQLGVYHDFYSYLGSDERDQRTCYGKTIETPYGKQLTYTLAKHLKTVGLTGPTGAYVAALDNSTKIALYWN